MRVGNMITTSLLVYLSIIISGCHFNVEKIVNTYLVENALSRAQEFTGSNEEWIPHEQFFDDMAMVLVPVGCFMMGSEDGDWDEVPVHKICFETPFWIGKYEVTNEQYGSVECPEYSSTPSQPRNCIDWLEAHEFCVSRMMRLPTEAEWEYSARGPDNLRYPWGNEWDRKNAINTHNLPSKPSTSEVGSTLGGVSWVGAFDLSGNLWEWTSSKNANYPYDSKDGREIINDSSGWQIRGGSWNNSFDYLRAANRGAYDRDIAEARGFRCAKSFQK